MSNINQVSDEKLNAFVDKQLTAEERMRVFDAIGKDEELSRKLCDLQRNDELLEMSYSSIPAPAYNPYDALMKTISRKRQMLAASLLFACSVSLGWFLHQQTIPPAAPSINDISALNVTNPGNNKVLIHISNMDAAKIETALEKAEALLKLKDTNIQLEIVANAQGLDLLRDKSPYADQIHRLASENKNVSFKACGSAIKTAELKEQREIILLPDAEKVPAALDQILQRLKAGWMYFKP